MIYEARPKPKAPVKDGSIDAGCDKKLPCDGACLMEKPVGVSQHQDIMSPPKDAIAAPILLSPVDSDIVGSPMPCPYPSLLDLHDQRCIGHRVHVGAGSYTSYES